MNGEPAGILAYSRPLYRLHDMHQMYFWKGLAAALPGGSKVFAIRSMGSHPVLVSFLGRARESAKVRRILRGSGRAMKLLERAGHKMEGPVRSPSRVYHTEVGQYLFGMEDGRELKVCIDGADYGDTSSPELLAWSDLYFKTNFWKGRPYPPRVRCLVNANPLILGDLDRLRAYRDAAKEYDICFVVRVWGGTNESEGIEHNMRLLEAVSRAGGRKFLFAYLVAGDVGSLARRLDRQGIRWGTKPVPLKELWDVSSRSAVCVIRLGMHFCIPWRMTDLLAMGACPVIDSTPYTLWPRPLVEGEHFLSLGLAWGPRKMVAGEEEYDAVPGRIEKWLGEGEALARIRENAARYFDGHMDPAAVGRYILDTVAGHAAA